MRLIDADALKSWIDCGHLRPPTELCFSELDVVQILDMRPTIDAVPVVHARWKMTDSPYCSHCNRVSVLKYRYCPSCGARMDGDPHGSGQ